MSHGIGARSTGTVVLVDDNRDRSFDTDDPNGWFNPGNGAPTANRYMNMNPARAESVGIWVAYEYEYEYIPASINGWQDININISPPEPTMFSS